MAEKTLSETIIDLIHDESTKTPPPTRITITKNHNNGYADIDNNGEIMKNIECIGTNFTTGDVGLLFETETGDYMVITK